MSDTTSVSVDAIGSLTAAGLVRTVARARATMPSKSPEMHLVRTSWPTARDRIGPLDDGNAHRYAWCGDDVLLAYLWRVLGEPGLEITLDLGEPSLSRNVTNRKTLAKSLHSEMTSALVASRRGMETPEGRLSFTAQVKKC